MTPLNEKELAQQLSHYLDAGSDQIDAGVRDRLVASRRHALSLHVRKWGNTHLQNSPFTMVALWPSLKVVLAIAVLGFGIAFNLDWNVSDETFIIEEIDSGLLADDIPPNAYIDPGFRKWLERTSPNSVL